MENPEIIQCPYDANHHVRYSRATQHVRKCRQRWLDELQRKGCTPDVLECKNDWMHEFYVPEIEYHYTFCKVKVPTPPSVIAKRLGQFVFDPNFRFYGPEDAALKAHPAEDEGTTPSPGHKEKKKEGAKEEGIDPEKNPHLFEIVQNFSK